MIESRPITIKAPNLETTVFEVIGDAPLVVHRFSQKAHLEMLNKMRQGSTAKKGQKREPIDVEKTFNGARYFSAAGWDGFNASAVRNSLISACRLVGFKMTLGKLSLFVEPDGWDKNEPHIPLIRIYGTAKKLEMKGLTDTKAAYISIRPIYYPWTAKVQIRYDADQFTLTDVTNLMMRVGQQVGWCEGRPDSKNSAGMGWGVFHLKNPN